MMKVAPTPHQEKFISKKMKSGGSLSPDEIAPEALRVYELVERDDTDPSPEAALGHCLRGPLKKYRSGHFASLANRNRR